MSHYYFFEQSTKDTIMSDDLLEEKLRQYDELLNDLNQMGFNEEKLLARSRARAEQPQKVEVSQQNLSNLPPKEQQANQDFQQQNIEKRSSEQKQQDDEEQGSQRLVGEGHDFQASLKSKKQDLNKQDIKQLRNNQKSAKNNAANRMQSNNSRGYQYKQSQQEQQQRQQNQSVNPNNQNQQSNQNQPVNNQNQVPQRNFQVHSQEIQRPWYHMFTQCCSSQGTSTESSIPRQRRSRLHQNLQHPQDEYVPSLEDLD